MGVIRGFFVVIVAVLLFFSVFSLNLFGILSSSLTYENVQEKAEIVLEDVLTDLNVTSIIEQRYPMIVSFCQNNSEVVINSEYIFSDEGLVFDIPCESALQGIDVVVDEGIRSVVHKIYYGNYSENATDYLSTPQDAPLFLISEQAQILSNKAFYYSLLASLILIGLLFLLTKRKSNTFLLPGIFMVFSSLIFFKINDIFSLFSDGILFKFLGIFFSTAFPVSIRLLIAGILLILIAVFFKAFRVGFWISSLVEKFKEKKPVQMQKKGNK
ncbi:hypothetical protein M0R72_03550 [Candidatus Pacearchaeota archaeon]|jgi:hypothetical protein|nr:hypothetical protein [Candidatus Pacearchaeota archaeon]